jgi:hypothetical protein
MSYAFRCLTFLDVGFCHVQKSLCYSIEGCQFNGSVKVLFLPASSEPENGLLLEMFGKIFAGCFIVVLPASLLRMTSKRVPT